jgi:hypothetical protein
MRPYHRCMGIMALIASLGCLSAEARAEPESTRSFPPDTTPYLRTPVPEEGAPYRNPTIQPPGAPPSRKSSTCPRTPRPPAQKSKRDGPGAAHPAPHKEK